MIVEFLKQWEDRLRRILQRNEARFERLVVAMEKIAAAVPPAGE